MAHEAEAENTRRLEALVATTGGGGENHLGNRNE